jgi:hypothetical protein
MAQARMTRARGLHATRSRRWSDNDTSSLLERSIACRFFLFRWHRARACHTLNVRTATSIDRWPGSQGPISCVPYHGHIGASGEPLGAAATRRIGRECALCPFFLCKSCFIRDIDLHQPMAWFPGAYILRAVLGKSARLGSRWARLPHAGFAGKCGLCAFFLCKSCFIRDIDLCGPMASLLALHA